MPFHYILWTRYYNTHTHTSELKLLYQSALLSFYRHIPSFVYLSQVFLRYEAARRRRTAGRTVECLQLSAQPGSEPARAESADTTPPPHPPAFTLTHAHTPVAVVIFTQTQQFPPARRGDASTESFLAHNKAHKARCQGSSRRLRPTGSCIRERGQRLFT